MQENILIDQVKLKTQIFFQEFDKSEFTNKLNVLIKFINENHESVLSAKQVLGQNTEEFLYFSDCIYLMGLKKFMELIEDCKMNPENRKLILLTKADAGYGKTMWEEYTYILTNYSNWPMSDPTRISWSLPILEFGSLKNIQVAKTNSSGCYIATMAFGDYDHPQVMILRQFRDDVLDKSVLGKWFIKAYYHYSPRLVEKLKNKNFVNSIIRKILNQFIKLIK